MKESFRYTYSLFRDAQWYKHTTSNTKSVLIRNSITQSDIWLGKRYPECQLIYIEVYLEGSFIGTHQHTK